MTALHRAAGSNGFTLIELLVAMSVVALLSVLLFGGLRFAAHSAGAVNRRTDDATQVALAYDFMKHELAAAQALAVTAGRPRSPMQFDGGPESVTFVALPPAHVTLGGFLVFRMALQNNDSQSRLTISWSRVGRGFPERGSAMRRPALLMEGVRSLQLAYYGRIVANQPPAWTDNWSGRPDLPRLVRMRVTLEDGYRSPDMIVALQLRRAAQP